MISGDHRVQRFEVNPIVQPGSLNCLPSRRRLIEFCSQLMHRTSPVYIIVVGRSRIFGPSYGIRKGELE